jgi:hypothetical protein
VDQLSSTGTDDDPIIVIYHHVEGSERVTSLAGLPVLDLIARHELTLVAQSPRPESLRNAPVLSAVRRLSGAILFNPASPETLAEDFGFPYLSLDGVAINPEIGFIIFRSTPGKARDGRARTLLLWESAEDSFDGMSLMTDAAEVAARLYGERPKASATLKASQAAPRP